MDRRQFLTTVGVAGATATAGCGALRTSTTLSDPTLTEESPSRRSLHFSADGEEVGSIGVDGDVSSSVFVLPFEIWHREDTRVTAIDLRVWMPADEHADVAVVSPMTGDQGDPPQITLYPAERRPGTMVDIDELGDLADETISTLELLVRPLSDTASEVMIDCSIKVEEGGVFGTDYTLEGRLDLEFSSPSEQ